MNVCEIVKYMIAYLILGVVFISVLPALLLLATIGFGLAIIVWAFDQVRLG